MKRILQSTSRSRFSKIQVNAASANAKSGALMRKVAVLCSLFACVSALSARDVILLSGDDWTADGEPVTVPHTWNAVDGSDGFGDPRQTPSSADSYERKAVAYRRSLPDPKIGKRYFLRCGGASIVATVRVNGKEIGRHVGGFTAFVFDITSALEKKGNHLEIEVDNRFDRNIPPYSADFTVYGGLYRDVWLVETDSVYFDSVPDGGPGIVVEANPANGRVTVQPRVAGAAAPSYTLRIEGPGLAEPIAVNGLTASVPSPKLWSPETPNLYKATVTVRDGKHSDTVSLPFGFRKVEFDGEGLFRLNGKVRKIRGVNYHQDREGKGWATSIADRAADIRMIKELGADGVRTAHYPHSPDVYDECDRLGLLAWIEMPNVNIITVSDAYRANAMRLAAETVAQYRHHPSIFLWSTSNEIKLVRSKEENAGMTALERDLDAYVRKTDPSRPTALATFKPLQTEFNSIPTAIGFNFYPGWYRFNADEMDAQIDDALAKNPQLKAIAVSEYGAGATPGEFESPDVRNGAGAPFHSEGYAAYVHHLNYRSIAAHPRVWGSFVWLMFDFASDTRREGGRFGLNDKGLVGFDHQTKKASYWLYKANWGTDPVLHLVGEGRRVTTNSVVRIMSFSNVGSVSLTVNGKDFGTRATDEVKTAVWDGIPLDLGDNTIEVKSGNRTAKAVWRYAQPVTVHVAPDGSDIMGDGSAAKPFATAVRARDALRSLKRAGRLDAGGTVIFADGVYAFTNALELTAEDSGTKRFPIVWKAANRAKAVVTGSVNLKWSPVNPSDPVYSLLPETARGKVRVAELSGDWKIPGFRSVGCFTDKWQHDLVESPVQLYQGDGRLHCARWPNDGWTKMGKQHGTNIVVRGTHELMYMDGIFEFGDKARLARWAKEPDLWAHGCWYFYWADSREKVLNVDPEKGLVRIDTALEHWGFREGNDFYVFNAVSELDRPGEWAVDRSRRKVYAWMEDETNQVEVALSKRLVSAKGLRHVRFSDLVFSGSLEDALAFEKSHDVRLLASVVRHTGKWGVRFDGGTRGLVEGCDVYDLGEGGIYLGGGDQATLTPANHLAENNHVYYIGRNVPNRPGIALFGVGSRAERNLVHHGDQIGIEFKGNDHYIGYNICHDLCEHNDDAGVLYGYNEDLSCRGVTIEYNVVHMTGPQPRADHVNGVYLDAWTSGVTVRGNLINRAPQGIWSSGGQANLIEKNVIMNCEKALSRGNLGEGHPPTKHVWSKGWNSHLMKKMVKNRDRFALPPWRGKYRNMSRVIGMDNPAFAISALWATITNNMFIGCGRMTCHHWEKTKAYTTLGGNEAMEGDPGFVDYYGFDWRLKPDSPLRKFLGGDTKFDRMGLYRSPNRVSPPVKFAANATKPRPLTGEFAYPEASVHLTLVGGLPKGVKDMADGLENCTMPGWGHGKRITADLGRASDDKWVDYTFSFVPLFDSTVEFWLMGMRGEMTLYDDFRVEGAELKDPGFESGLKMWRTYREDGDNPLFPGGLKRPHGVFATLPHAAGADYMPFEGKGMASANANNRIRQSGIKVKKGVRVTVSFRARAYNP